MADGSTVKNQDTLKSGVAVLTKSHTAEGNETFKAKNSADCVFVCACHSVTC